MHQFKGSSSSFGAQRMAELCVALREACGRRDAPLCTTLVGQLRLRFEELRLHLERFLELERARKVAAAGGGDVAGAAAPAAL